MSDPTSTHAGAAGRTGEDLMTPGEVAARFGVDPHTVNRWARTGRLPAVRTLGGHRRYRRADVEALATPREGPGEDLAPPVDGPSHGACWDCGRRYGDEYGFPDLVIPDDVWARISPTGDEGGLLCPSCICRRLHLAGIATTGHFTSGPLRSVAQAGAR